MGGGGGESAALRGRCPGGSLSRPISFDSCGPGLWAVPLLAASFIRPGGDFWARWAKMWRLPRHVCLVWFVLSVWLIAFAACILRPDAHVKRARVHVYGLLRRPSPSPSPTLMTSRNFRSALSDTCVFSPPNSHKAHCV